MTTGHVAVIDIGKTNAKLALVDLSDLSEIAVITRPNTVRPGPPWPHFDVEGHWTFLLDGLRRYHADHGVDAISVTTHGACVALLDDAGGLAAPILDYEHGGPDSLRDAYDALRPNFDETGSPRLPMGLNVGAQMFWQFARDPALKDRTARIVTYPQFWSGRLTGVAATDVTSLGCHTDLWNAAAGRFSSLVTRLGIDGKIAPARRSAEILGPLLPDIAAATGLRPDTPVHCGIHDSNASLLPHLLRHAPPFSVVSTGTWVICMAMGGAVARLDPARDMLVNVNAMGDPVPSARFMGGREHDLAAQGPYPDAREAELAELLRAGPLLLPAVEPGSGPFQGRQSVWLGREPAPGTAARGAAIGLYLALMTDHCLRGIGHAGRIIVEGPFARNAVFLRMLAHLTGSPVETSGGMTGTSQGAGLLATEMRLAPEAAPASATASDPLSDLMTGYAATWRERACD